MTTNRPATISASVTPDPLPGGSGEGGAGGLLGQLIAAGVPPGPVFIRTASGKVMNFPCEDDAQRWEINAELNPGDCERVTGPNASTTPVFTVRSWGEVLDLELPPRKFILGDLFACGQIQVVFGQGGLGKSRLALNAARNQVLRIPFLGVETGDAPMRHLFIGSENDIYRWQIDTRCMTKGLSAFQREQLAANIRMSTLENPGDCFINLGESDNVEKWRATLAPWAPDVLWVDPWGDVITGDGFDRDVRATLATLRKLASEVNPDCGIIILAHARTGANNIAQAVGFDAANFGKDSKALYSAARAVVNIAPFDASDNPDLVWVPAKNNNGKRSETLRIRLDPLTLSYSLIEVLDVAAWQADVKASQKERRIKAGVEFDDPAVIVLCTSPVTKTELHAAVRKLGVTERDTRAGIDRLIRIGKIVEKPAGDRNKKLIGTPQSFQT